MQNEKKILENKEISGNFGENSVDFGKFSGFFAKNFNKIMLFLALLVIILIVYQHFVLLGLYNSLVERLFDVCKNPVCCTNFKVLP